VPGGRQPKVIRGKGWAEFVKEASKSRSKVAKLILLLDALLREPLPPSHRQIILMAIERFFAKKE